MIDSILLWVFVWISKRWFPCIIFSSNPETERATAIHFFDNEQHAKNFMEFIEKYKLDCDLKEQK